MSRYSPLLRLAAVLVLFSGAHSLFAVAKAPPHIAPVLQPVTPASSALIGQHVQFTVTVSSGTTPLRYQWSHDGKAIAGASTATYQISKVTAASAGNYSVTVKNAYGSATASFGYLAVHGPPVILSKLQATSPAIAGYGALLGVTGDDTTTSYQWFHNGQPLPYTDGAIFLKKVTGADAGNYTVVLTNPWGNTTSTVSLVVKSDPHPSLAAPVALAAVEYATYTPRGGKTVNAGVLFLNYARPVATFKVLGAQAIGGVFNAQLSSTLASGSSGSFFHTYYVTVPITLNCSGWFVVTVDGRLIGPPVQGFL